MKYEAQTTEIRDGFPHRMKAAHLDELEAFLADKTVVPLRELELYQEGGPIFTDTTTIGMRHDVDHNLDHAIKFAEWEHDRGIRSSYYVLHTAWYYEGPRAAEHSVYDLEEGCHHLVELGHEVGLHSNAVICAQLAGLDSPQDGYASPSGDCEGAASILRHELEKLRALGLEIVGTASHGDHRCKELGVNNADIWGAGHKPEDFGLTYEAYHLNRARTYVSDNHGHWHRGGDSNDTPFVEPFERQPLVLIHPCHWEIPER